MKTNILFLTIICALSITFNSYAQKVNPSKSKGHKVENNNANKPGSVKSAQKGKSNANSQNNDGIEDSNDGVEDSNDGVEDSPAISIDEEGMPSKMTNNTSGNGEYINEGEKIDGSKPATKKSENDKIEIKEGTTERKAPSQQNTGTSTGGRSNTSNQPKQIAPKSE